MANMYLNQFHYSPIPMLTSIFAKVSIGATGAPTLVTAGGMSKGVASISRTAAGAYTVTLSDTFNYFVGMRSSFVAAGGPAAPNVNAAAEDVDGAKTISVLCQAGGVDTDPANGEIMNLEFILKNSSAF